MSTEFDYSKGSSNPYTVDARHGLIRSCLVCRQFDPITLDGTSYFQYFQAGAFVQVAFASLSAAEREHVLTGVHPKCQDVMFYARTDEEEENAAEFLAVLDGRI